MAKNYVANGDSEMESRALLTDLYELTMAAWPRKIVDFSLRRTQGTDAGLKVARASYIGGFIGTSNVLAGKIYDCPIFGTMAHSFITSFDTEKEDYLVDLSSRLRRLQSQVVQGVRNKELIES